MSVEAHLQDTCFVDVLGKSPKTKILDFLIENRRESWSLTEISDNSSVSYSMVKSILPSLLEEDIVEITKKIGKANLYRINSDNKIASLLIDLRDKIVKFQVEKYINK